MKYTLNLECLNCLCVDCVNPFCTVGRCGACHDGALENCEFHCPEED